MPAARDRLRHPMAAAVLDGHKRVDETLIYVHVAENHRREIPACVMEAGQAETDR
jgi:hypothetical protein